MAGETGFSLERADLDDVTVLRLRGELDMAYSAQLRDAVEGVVRDGRTELVVDASGLGFIDSRGVAALIEGYQQVDRHGSAFLIVPSPAVRRLFEVVGLWEMFQPAETVEEALDSIRRREGR